MTVTKFVLVDANHHVAPVDLKVIEGKQFPCGWSLKFSQGKNRLSVHIFSAVPVTEAEQTFINSKITEAVQQGAAQHVNV